MALIDLTLRPNRSLSRVHARWVIGGVAGILLLGGLRFVALGAWPVLPCLAVDAALLWWAFRASYRSGRAFETVRLDDGALTVRKVSASGAERRFRLEPFWARARLDKLASGDNRLWLASGQVKVRVGSELSPPERADVHAVLVDGLAKWREG